MADEFKSTERLTIESIYDSILINTSLSAENEGHELLSVKEI